MRSTQTLLPGATFDPQALSTPEQAIAAYRAAFTFGPRDIERVPLSQAAGRVLAADAVASDPVPADPRSTMDGFAVRSADGDTVRRIVGEIRMGQAPPADLGPGEAMAIPTGGVLPAGADAVVPVEDATVDGVMLRVHEAPEADACYTPRASDLKPGECVIAAGRRIGGPELGVLATLGATEVAVFTRPRFAIVSTGDELVDVGARPATGQVRDSNRWAIGGALAAMGADVVHLERATDERDVLRARIAEGLQKADAVILTGGSSVGERDLTPDVIDSFDGPGVIVHGLRVRPGKPTVLAAIGHQPVIGLPGNPSSALMILEAVCAPIIAQLCGETDRRASTLAGIAGEALVGRADWTWFVPVEIRTGPGGERVHPFPIRSAHTSLLARAQGYVVLSQARHRIEAGEAVTVVRFGSGGRA
jgi:molybdopterin molybdotransferase